MIPRNPSEGEILDRGIALLKEILPSNWQVRRGSAAQRDEGLADMVLDIAGPQGAARAVVEINRSFAPKDVEAVAREASLLRRIAGSVPVLVMAPWLSDRSRGLLAQAGINYVDLKGNVRFVSDYPTVFIDRRSDLPGPVNPQSTPSLRGVKAGRLARLLADVRPPYGVLELAKRAGVTAGYVSRLLEALERENVVERTKQGGVSRVAWRELLEQRVASYGVFTSNRVQRFVCPNGPAYALEVAGRRSLGSVRMALTGSFAAERIVAMAPPSLLLLFAQSEPAALIEDAGLLPADAGANVVIATPYDAVAMEPRWPAAPAHPPGIPLVAASQMVLDCLTGNGRMPQEGRALLDWMTEDEGRWRLPNLAALPRPEAMA
jgi:hypothetical protein